MPKLLITSMLFLTAALFASCSKESATTGAVPVPPQTPPSTSLSQSVRIVSPWFSPVFSVVNDRSSIYLNAHRVSETPLNYDRATHVELAYVKLSDQGISITRRLSVVLPGTNSISNKLCEIDFGLNNAGCDVSIRNADRNSPPVITANPFPDMQVRYIVISKALFESLGIDWDDYAAVTLVLNI